ncbi:hypothetical protein DL766_008155 [Monosporascus sp. MC13-8B]|uniref:Uncharacterized protein n=1 Tax=Monosporascus cannonballus TaxID=155416 RepID=A0ABY0GR10_9PEZI|nr:hypothetical protein DL762_010279 [Monosporascus cannonballus]RYO81456.1 hypothetical protein DL763_008583 [Monosporascus cannonballus]RYP20604.1 hypothetical protein DL766_008155 [Monosporascus sp. MC13-8B]
MLRFLGTDAPTDQVSGRVVRRQGDFIALIGPQPLGPYQGPANCKPNKAGSPVIAAAACLALRPVEFHWDLAARKAGEVPSKVLESRIAESDYIRSAWRPGDARSL